jgi:hypothetical protein
MKPLSKTKSFGLNGVLETAQSAVRRRGEATAHEILRKVLPDKCEPSSATPYPSCGAGAGKAAPIGKSGGAGLPVDFMADLDAPLVEPASQGNQIDRQESADRTRSVLVAERSG